MQLRSLTAAVVTLLALTIPCAAAFFFSPPAARAPSTAVPVGCLQEGCDQLRRYAFSPLPLMPAANRTVRVGVVNATQWVPPHPRCSSTGEMVVCTASSGEQHQHEHATPLVVMAAFDASLQPLWRYTLNASSPTLPLTMDAGGPPMMNDYGQTVSSDGRVLVGVEADGAPFGDAITIVPAMAGGVYGLSITSNAVILIASRRDTLAGYLTNGVPHASIMLNAVSPDGRHNGTYFSRGPPLVLGSRCYLTTTFVADAPSKNGGEQPPFCRLYAVDISRTMANRMTVAWEVQLPCPANQTDRSTPASPGFVATALESGVLCTTARNNVTMGSDDWLCVQDNGDSATLLPPVHANGRIVAAAQVSADMMALAVLGQNSTYMMTVDSAKGVVMGNVSVGTATGGAQLLSAPIMVVLASANGTQAEPSLLTQLWLPGTGIVVGLWGTSPLRFLHKVATLPLADVSSTSDQQMLWLGHDGHVDSNSATLVIPLAKGLGYIQWE